MLSSGQAARTVHFFSWQCSGQASQGESPEVSAVRGPQWDLRVRASFVLPSLTGHSANLNGHQTKDLRKKCERH